MGDVVSFICVSIGDVHAKAVPALTAANDTEKICVTEYR